MLLEPNLKTLERCLAEVADERHPEHIQGNGPEQDYLSRAWAPRASLQSDLEFIEILETSVTSSLKTSLTST